MSREIKFRAWHKELKEMFWFDATWGNTYAHGAGWVGMLRIGEVKEYIGGFCGHDNRVQIDPDNCELMQYTGLQDKKRTEQHPEGQEIYNKDILKDDDSDRLELVVWDSGCWWIKDIKTDEFKYPLIQELHYKTVIGNVYENPELLEIR